MVIPPPLESGEMRNVGSGFLYFLMTVKTVVEKVTINFQVYFEDYTHQIIFKKKKDVSSEPSK